MANCVHRQISPAVRLACPQTEKQVARPSPEYYAHRGAFDRQRAEALQAPAERQMTQS